MEKNKTEIDKLYDMLINRKEPTFAKILGALIGSTILQRNIPTR